MVRLHNKILTAVIYGRGIKGKVGKCRSNFYFLSQAFVLFLKKEKQMLVLENKNRKANIFDAHVFPNRQGDDYA